MFCTRLSSHGGKLGGRPPARFTPLTVTTPAPLAAPWSNTVPPAPPPLIIVEDGAADEAACGANGPPPAMFRMCGPLRFVVGLLRAASWSVALTSPSRL